MAQAVSRRLLKTDARVRARISPDEICCAQNGTGSRFSPICSIFPCQYHSNIPSLTTASFKLNNKYSSVLQDD
jgi:hypothetical protein